MSSQKYASPLRIKLVPSRILLSTELFVHLGAVALLVPLGLPALLKLVLIVAIIMSALGSAYVLGWGVRWKLLAKMIGTRWPRFSEVLWDHDDQWLLTDECGATQLAQLRPTTLVHRQLVILNLRVSGSSWFNRYRSIILLRDNVDSETFRRLRIRLRWYVPAAAENSAALK